MKITVGIPTYNRPQYALQTVKEVLKQKHESVIEIIVVDQTKWENIFEEHKLEWRRLQQEDDIKYITAPNPSLTAARNVVLQRAKGELVVFLDDDVLLPSGFFDAHLRCYLAPNHKGEKKVIAATGQEYRRKESADVNPEALSLDEITNGTVPVFPFDTFNFNHQKWLLGANHSILKEYAIACGGYDENIKIYGEDVDITNRLMRRFGEACSVAYNPEAYILHLRVPTGGCRIGSKSLRSEYDNIIGYHLIYFRDYHIRDKGIRYLISTLRAGPLRRENIVKPWRQPLAWFDFFKSLLRANLLRNQVKSPFTAELPCAASQA